MFFWTSCVTQWMIWQAHNSKTQTNKLTNVISVQFQRTILSKSKEKSLTLLENELSQKQN